MAAKSILNEFYQRLRTAAPVYKTVAGPDDDGFACSLLLPPVPGADEPKLQQERHYAGSGASKKARERGGRGDVRLFVCVAVAAAGARRALTRTRPR